MTYGPMSSAANIGTSMLSSFLAPELQSSLSGLTGDDGKPLLSPWLTKAIAAGVPAIAAGGIGSALSGDKYGMINAIPAGIVGALSLSGKGSDPYTSQLAEAKKTVDNADPTAIAKGKVLGADTKSKLQYGGAPPASEVFKAPDILQSPTTAAGDAAKTPTSGGSSDLSSSGGIFGNLMSTPEGRMIIAMMLANTTSSIGTTAGTDAYYNKLNKQTNQVNALQGAQQRAYINKSLGYAMGGPLSPNVERQPQAMYPQSMMPGADRRMGASQVRREVISQPSFKHGELVGPGDGMSDSIEANIDGKRKAKVATGEYVVPREAAEKYGDKLNKMMKAVRAAAHPKKGEQVKQDAAKREFIRQMSGVKA